MISILAKKNEGVEVKYKEENYTGLFGDAEGIPFIYHITFCYFITLKIGEDYDNDHVDKRFKINCKDVEAAVEQVAHKSIWGVLDDIIQQLSSFSLFSPPPPELLLLLFIFDLLYMRWMKRSLKIRT